MRRPPRVPSYLCEADGCSVRMTDPNYVPDPSAGFDADYMPLEELVLCDGCYQRWVGAEEASKLIDAAVSYTTFVVKWERAVENLSAHPDDDPWIRSSGVVRLMARDLPRPGRRCTNLTSGTEWFDITGESLRRFGFVSMEVES